MLHMPVAKTRRKRLLLESKLALEGMDPLVKLAYLTGPGYIQEVQKIAEEEYTARGSYESGHYKDRFLQVGGSVNELIGTFQQCIFRNNQQGPTKSLSTFGIVTAFEPSNTMIFENCIFTRNEYGNPAIQVRFIICARKLTFCLLF